MKIGLSTTAIQRGRTGVAQYVFALVRALLAKLEPGQLVLFVFEGDLPLFEFARARAKIVPVPERFRSPVKDIVWHQVWLPRWARRLQLEVLHVPTYRRMLWARPCPLVATIHDLAPFHLRNKYDPLRMFYGRAVVPRLARRQDRIIAISQTTADDVKRFLGCQRDRVSVIYNGLDHERFRPEGESVREKLPMETPHQPYFLYVARLEHPAKNHVRLIKAFELFKASMPSKWRLVFGGSDWHGARVIHDAINRSPVGRDIACLGFVPDAQLAGLYRAAGALVYPSLFEGFGMPPVEAMACGCPVISSRCGAFGEVVGDAAAIVDATDVRSIARQLTAVAVDPALRARLREKGLVRAQKFNWAEAAAATLAVYQSAIAQGQPVAREARGARTLEEDWRY